MKTALVVCPGRGSYARDCRGSLAGIDADWLQTMDRLRREAGRPTVSELDGADKYDLRRHVAGEHASLLTAAVSWRDWAAISPDKVQVVAVTGNSMGFYTALGVAGALDLEATTHLIDTMGAYQRDNVIGGQLLYPVVDDQWRKDPDLVALVERAVVDTPGAFWSIRLGGQAVVGGGDEALAQLKQRLPEVQVGSHSYPLRLPLHSAFHTPLLNETSERALAELHLPFCAPSLPLIDGRGLVWRPRATAPSALAFYTLGTQVTETYDFTAALRVGLHEYAPNYIVLLGPGATMGSIAAQVMIELGWRGVRSKDDFLERQKHDPVVVSMRWPDQRALVS